MRKLCPNMKFGDQSRCGPLEFIRIKGRFVHDKFGIVYFMNTVTNAFMLKHISGAYLGPPANDNGERTAA